MTIILNDDWEKFEKHVSEILTNFDDLVEEQVKRLGLIYQAEVKEQITELGAVDTGRLRSSISMVSIDNRTVMVGTNLFYASWVNDGHKQDKRFVPGRWKGERFEYIPYPHNNGQGMMLKAKFVKGKHFMERSIYSAKPKMVANLNEFMYTILGELTGKK